VLTPNEIYQADQLGAAFAKLFPASLMGPDYLAALRGPLPKVRIMATGGIQPTTEAVAAWRQAGAACVGIDSRLLQTATAAELTAQIKQLLTAMQLPPA
jgi:2-dehydro-3-deoxyphosphogluconate aldolase / (4S)-4-hydroxy-2-oxoglutarate aldolase